MHAIYSQFVAFNPSGISLCERMVELIMWVVRTVVIGVLLLSAGVRAAYKPVDISDITGEQKKALKEAWTEMKRMPLMSRECFICEQLGLIFCKDYSQAATIVDGHPAIANPKGAHFVERGGKVTCWQEARDAAHERWNTCCRAAWGFKAESLFVPFEKDVQKIVCNVAKYLLGNMPKEHRWLMLALMGEMVYNGQGHFRSKRVGWWMENGLIAKSPPHEAKGYVFVDPEGKERDIRALLAANNEDWRWRQVIWRCENLVGSKDILVLFPEEVEAMRKYFNGRMSKEKDEAKAKNDALLVAADETMSSLPREKRLARIALAMGLYYLDHRDAGSVHGHLNPKTTIILPDGTKHSGEEFVDEAPGPLQQVPHEAILEYYRQPIEQMVRAVAKDRFGKMPAPLRDLLRAQLSRQLTELDGSPAEIREGISTIQTFGRAWRVPIEAPVDLEHTYFRNFEGKLLPFSMFNTYEQGYARTLRLVNLCAQILGKDETVNLIPPGNVETEVDNSASDRTR